ncbi:MAG: ATP-binding protein [Eubacterium sp.]|nr:ATP-binding protein [Eubacterium sp.]
MRKLPIGIQSFESLRDGGYIYVDKTRYVWDLVNTGKSYFLSRPRRFGKSLFLSTLEAYFQGQKDLFRGLAIEELENERGKDAWTAYPVIPFYLSGGQYREPDGLRNMLSSVLDTVIARYDLSGRYAVNDLDIVVKFRSTIEKLYDKTGHPAVVLVDEYDKPLLETMIVDEKQEDLNRQLYKSFFSVLKDEDRFLKFVFFTGVTKFSKVSVFSDLNQLRDISLSEETAGICGITEEELDNNFVPEIRSVANEQRMTEEECREKLEQTYDGYHFSHNGSRVYNPFSLLNAFQERDFRYYWFETGTPTFLIHKLMHSCMTVERLDDGVEATESQLMNYRAESTDPVPLFYQSGYLTITGFDREFRIYDLSFPNDEVRYGFMDSLVPFVLGVEDTENPNFVRELVLSLRQGNLERFFTILQSLFAGIPYADHAGRTYEYEWRNEIFLILRLLGQNVHCEVQTAEGRCDCVLETRDTVYIFEYKLDQPANVALKQIVEKGYGDSYAAESKKIIRVGVSFSSEKRNIVEWKSD